MGTINSSLLYHVNEATNLTTKILTSFFNDEISLKKEDYNNNSEYSSVMGYLISALCSANIYELINLIKLHYSHQEITSSGIPQYSDFTVAMYEVPKLLSNMDNGVANNEELGKLLWPTERAQGANSKYGENHRNTAALIGLVGYKGGRIVLTDFGQLFLSLNPAQQATLIPKLWLRVPLFYNYFGSDNHEATLKSDISILSDTTQKRRLSNIRIIIDIIKKGYYFQEEPKIPQVEQEVIDIPVKEPLQLIFYGAPGTGKSFTIDKMAKDDVTVRTTFHPDSDYASFVGAYKPTMQSMAMSYISEGIAKYAKAWNGHDAQEKKIVYKYVPQAFLKAYVAAWADLDNPHYLVIEEINRGNCAQIFGDLFQLLDRNNMGSSSYAIHADEDIAQFLATDANGFAELSEEQKDAIRSFVLVKDSGERLPIGQEILDGKKLLLPPNLYIWATMNTSDQSLFPIDSAFKRRWNWRYMPIDYTKKNHTFLVGDNRYSWGEFLRKMNPTISTLTESPDKQMGYFFAKPDLKSSDAAAENDTISEEIFLNKVLFYLWTDVLKDFDAGEPFLNEDTGRAYEFSEFFDTEKNYLQKFVDKLGLEVVEVVENTKCDSGKNRSDYSTLTVSFPDGTVISEPTVNDTYIKAIEKIGLERAAEAAADKKYQRRGHELISKVKYPDLEDEGYKYAQVGNYYVVLPTRSESLRGMLELMSDKFNLGLTITLE